MLGALWPRSGKQQLRDIGLGVVPIPLQALTRPADYDIKESVGNAMGVAAYRYRTRAARTAHELMLKGGTFGESTRTPGEQKLMAKHRAAIDAGRFDPDAVRADFKGGRLTERDARTLMTEAKTPQLIRDFRRLSLEKALQVWEVANDQERNFLRPILLRKRKQLENRVPAERVALEDKLKAALSETSAPPAVIPQVFSKLLGRAAQ